jgi:hypothetical protein
VVFSRRDESSSRWLSGITFIQPFFSFESSIASHKLTTDIGSNGQYEPS